MAEHASTSPISRRTVLVVGVVVLLLVVWVAAALGRPGPRPGLVPAIASTWVQPGSPLNVDPHSVVQEAVAVSGLGTVAATSGQTPTPIASLTKIMSALVILHDHPLTLGESGPSIVITPADVAQYRLEKARGDSVVAVRAGESISELQALEMVLIPSGDNIMQLLATWDAGTSQAFVAEMNALAHALGMRHTTYAGTSGVDPASLSTASDQLRLAQVAMSNPVFAGIVAMPQATFPVAGVVYNVNADLGTDGIDGVKTGWLPQAGGCLVVAAHDRVGSAQVTLLGVILGTQGVTPIPTALRDGRHLIATLEQSVRQVELAVGSTVAHYQAANGQVVPVVTTSPLHLVGLGASAVRVTLSLRGRVPAQLAAGSTIGTVALSLGDQRVSSVVRTTSAISGSSLAWRFLHW